MSTSTQALTLSKRTLGRKWDNYIYTPYRVFKIVGTKTNIFATGEIWGPYIFIFVNWLTNADLLPAWTTAKDAGGGPPEMDGPDFLVAGDSIVYAFTGGRKRSSSTISRQEVLTSADQGVTWNYTQYSLGNGVATPEGPITSSCRGLGRAIVAGRSQYLGPFQVTLYSVSDSSSSGIGLDHSASYQAAQAAAGQAANLSIVDVPMVSAAGKVLIVDRNGTSGNKLFTATDMSSASVTFTRQTAFEAMANPSAGLFITLVSSGQTVMAFMQRSNTSLTTSVSNDGGVTWSAPSSALQAAIGTDNVGGFAWTGDCFFAQAGDDVGSGLAAVSTDGTTWTITSGASSPYSGLTFFWNGNYGVFNWFTGGSDYNNALAV